MENEFLYLEKQILREHYDRFLIAHYDRQFMHLRFLFDYIHKTTFFNQVCENIVRESGHRLSYTVYTIVHSKDQGFIPDDYKERSHIAYLVVKDVVAQNQSKFVSNAAMKYMKDQQVGLDVCYAVFNELFVEPFVSFVLNQSDKNLLLTKLLNQYKNRTEWFNRARLNELVAWDNGIYEHRLAADLYKYIFDRGMELVMQPASPSGEVDFLASQKNSRHRLLIEAKVFDGKSRHKQHVIAGYKQCIHYAADYNEYAAYLVVFNVSGKSLSIPGGHSIHGFVDISGNNVIVYIMIVDIYIYQESASKRVLNEMIEFSIEDFR